MNRSFVLLAIPALMLSAACSAQSGTEAEIGSEDVATVQEALTVVDGFGVTWTKVGTPGDANYLASCGNYLIAQNDNGSIWVNASGGIDSGWSWHANRTTASSGIGCNNGSTLYVMNSAAPKNMYRSYNWGVNWTFMDAPYDAQRIGSGGDLIWVINNDKSLYSGTSSYNGAWSGWTYRGPGTHGTDADRITGGKGYFAANYRVFTLNEYTALWYNDKLLTSSSTSNWKTFPTGGRSYDEIAAASSTKLYALTSGTRELWRADVTEEGCFDGVDNDNDSFKDGADYDCNTEYAQKTCDTYGTGKWCIGRVTTASTAPTLVTCSGTTVSSTASGDTCTETAANNGTDYLTIIK